jgi:hypothetical protein
MTSFSALDNKKTSQSNLKIGRILPDLRNNNDTEDPARKNSLKSELSVHWAKICLYMGVQLKYELHHTGT